MAEKFSLTSGFIAKKNQKNNFFMNKENISVCIYFSWHIYIYISFEIKYSVICKNIFPLLYFWLWNFDYVRKWAWRYSWVIQGILEDTVFQTLQIKSRLCLICLGVKDLWTPGKKQSIIEIENAKNWGSAQNSWGQRDK